MRIRRVSAVCPTCGWWCGSIRSAVTRKRTYRAWVLDSLDQRRSRRSPHWKPPDPRVETQIHTAPGVIRRVSRGWGEWDNTVPFDPLTTAYYPECRTRLGFYDDLSDLGR